MLNRLGTYLLLFTAVLCGLLYTLPAEAETQNTVTLTAPQLFTGYQGSFNVSQSSGAVAVAAGTMDYTYAGIMKYSLASASGRYAGLAGSTAYGISFGPFQLFQSFLSANFLTVVSAATLCPSAQNYNWILIRARTPDHVKPMDTAHNSYFYGGNLTYDPSAGNLITGNSMWNLYGPTNNSAPNYSYAAFNGVNCTSGTQKISGNAGNWPLDQYGTFFFGDSAFTYISSGGSPVVAIGTTAQTLSGGTMTGIADHVFTGLYMSYLTSSTQTRKNIFMTPDSAGTTFTLTQANDLSDPSNQTALGTLTCTSLNSPSNGFCSGTLALNGYGGTGNAVCLVSTTTPEAMVACHAQHPNNTRLSIGIIARVPMKSVISATIPGGVASVAGAGNSTTIAVTIKNLSGRAVSTMANPSSGALQLAAPFTNPGAYSGAGGTCGSSLKGYASCTLNVTFNPSAVGTYKQTFRVAYSDGYFGTVNATVPIIGTAGLVSIAVTPSTAGFAAGSNIQYTATATYSDASTQDITQVATWSSDNSAVATTSTQGTVDFVGAGSVNIGAAFAGFSGSRNPTISGNTTIDVLGQSSATSIDGAITGLQNPRYVGVAATRLFISDTANHRVLIWNATPTSNQDDPDLVLGQEDLSSKSANAGGTVAQDTLSSPMGFASDGTKFVLADNANNRVLIWNTIPTSDQQPADVVLGQTLFTTATNNQGGIGSASLRGPNGVAISGTKLIVCDNVNNRVLIWNTIPTVNKTASDVVLGQPNFTSNTANNGGISAQTISGCTGVAVVGTKLFVADSGNNRILAWNTIPTVNQTAADFVLGQTNFTNSSTGTTSTTYNNPTNISSNGTVLYVADFSNNRVLIYNSVPSATNTAADYVLGQTLMTTATANNGGISASTLSTPYGVFVDTNQAYVADYANHRVLYWSTLPSSNKAASDLVLGQPTFATNTANSAGTPAADSLYLPEGTYATSGKYIVADTGNNRVLIWNSIPIVDGQTADVVLGQPDLTSNTINNGGRTAKSLRAPRAVYTDGTKLYVVDTGNNRVLIWNTIPTSSFTNADLELGQANFTAGGANAGGISAQTLNSPRGIYGDGTRLFVVDTSNNRVLMWNSMPTVNRQAADYVLGQPDFTSNTANNGGRSASTLNGPRGVYSNGTRIFVADYSNHRVLIWNSIPGSNGVAADRVLGQPDFASGTANNGGRAATTLNAPYGVYAQGSTFYTADYSNNRVLVWNALPTSNQQAADRVIGQPSFTVATANNGGVSAQRLSGPMQMYGDGDHLWITDRNNHRILASPTSAQLSISDGPIYDYGDLVVGGAIDKTFTVTNSGSATATSLGAGTPALTAPFLFTGGSYPGTGATCGSSLAGSASCTIKVRFFPSAEAAIFQDIVLLSYNDGSVTQTASVTVKGKSVLQASLTFTDGASYNYGIKSVGSTTQKIFTVSNASGVTASLMQPGTPALGSHYSFKGGFYPGNGGTCGTVLPTGQTCTIILNFIPLSTGIKSDTLRVQYNNGTASQTLSITLSGTGT